jgi:hypothetical protein
MLLVTKEVLARPSKIRGWGSSVGRRQHPHGRYPMRCSYLALATGHGNVDEAAGVCEPLLGAALGRLLLLLGFDLAFRLVVGGGRKCVGERTLGVCDLTFPARARDP